MVKKAIVSAIALASVCALISCAAGGGSTDPVEVKKTSEGEVSFSQTVLPILKDHCIRCHGEDKKGDLNIETYESVMKGGKSGSFIVAGDPDTSRIITSVEKTKEPFMPPRIFPALTEDRIQAIRQWISEGAKNN
jgi:mono/diheme cytochrome c family protein